MSICTIIIPTYNNAELLEKCIESIFRNTDYPNFEVIVVDNHSVDGTTAFLKNLKDPVRLIINPENLGFAKACNIGTLQAKGDVFVFLNNDTEVSPGWLSPLMTDLLDPEIGISGNKLLFADQTIQHAGIVFTYNNIPYHIFRGFPSTYKAANIRREMQAVTGACMAIKRVLFQKCGMFDEGYINGMEDIDLCLKAKAYAQKVIYNPRSIVYHFESKTVGRYAHADANNKKFLNTWKKVQAWDDYRFYMTDRALTADDPEGIHIILHFRCQKDPFYIFQHIFRQLYLVQGRFRFSIIKCFPDPIMDYLQQIFKGFIRIIDYSSTAFGEALDECIQGSKSPFIFHIEADKFFYGNMDLLLNQLESQKNTAIGIPFLQTPVQTNQNSCEKKEVTQINHTTLFFTRDILIDSDKDRLNYPEYLNSVINGGKVRRFETINFCAMPEGSFGI